MTQKQSEKTEEQHQYIWTNKNEYPHGNVQELGDKLLTSQTPESEETNVGKLFEHVMQKSLVSLLHIDDQSKQMNLYHIPSQGTSYKSNDTSYATLLQNDFKNRFSYITQAGFHHGQRGYHFSFNAISKASKYLYFLNYTLTLRERLDNSFTSNKHLVSFYWAQNVNLKWLDYFQFKLGRESRQNNLDFYDQKSKKQHKFGIKTQDTEITKQSNLYSFEYYLKKSILALTGKFGMDFDNKSSFHSLHLKMLKQFNITNSFRVKLTSQGANMWGKNILKNDMLFRNKSRWHGNRTTNYVSAKVDFQFIQYPYLSLLSWYPFIYSEIFGTFQPNQQNKVDTKMELDYGIGLASNDQRFRFSFSLLSLSKDRKSGVFGPIKFSF